MSPDHNQLALRLVKQIENAGSISVAEYMRAANQEYYARSDPFGVDGDFITAPEISQMFGEMLGLCLTDMWLRQVKPPNCHYVELGPGRGSLADDILRSMARFGFLPSRHFVETSQALIEKQAQLLGVGNWHETIETLPENGPLFVIANEFFDALPIRQMISTHAGWRERVIIRDQGTKFRAVPGSQSMDAIIPDILRNAPVQTIYETSSEGSAIVFALAKRIKEQGGVFLIIDYGYSELGFGDTLQAVQDHQYTDPFSNPGAVDLSAHVNFHEIVSLCLAQGLRVSGPVGQGEWLSALGINQRAAALTKAYPDRSDEIQSACQRLVAAEQMGMLFKVLAISSKDWVEPEGFSGNI